MYSVNNVVYLHQFMGNSTIVVDFETEDHNLINQVREELDKLGTTAQCKTVVSPHYIERGATAGDDVVKVWRFTVLSNQDDSCIKSVIDDLGDIAIFAGCINDEGSVWLK